MRLHASCTLKRQWLRPPSATSSGQTTASRSLACTHRNIRLSADGQICLFRRAGTRLSIACDAQPLRVPAEMVLDKRRYEEVGMIVAFVHTQRKRNTGSSARMFQKRRLELGFQELVCSALVDKKLRQPRAILNQCTSIVSSPTLLIIAEISTEGLLAPRAVHGRADRRKSRY